MCDPRKSLLPSKLSEGIIKATAKRKPIKAQAKLGSFMPVEIFCCYARKDQQFLQNLKTHLMPLQRQSLITIWSDTDINAGNEWEKEIAKHLNTAQIILLLVSPDFMASEYIYSIEMRRAMERHEAGEAQVIPIILRPVYWKDAPFAKLQMLPKDAKPITNWSDEDVALNNVTEGIRKSIDEMSKRRLQDSLATLTQATILPSQNSQQTQDEQGEHPSFPSRKHPVKKFKTLSKPMKIAYIGAAATLIAFAIIGGIFLLKSIHVGGGSPQPTPTAITSLPAANPYGGTLVLDDPLHDNSKGNGWDEYSDSMISCKFTGGAYHAIRLDTNTQNGCNASPDFSNFAFEVQMTIIKGGPGGIAFRVHITPNDTNDTFYMFLVDQYGEYSLVLFQGATSKTLVLPTFSTAIHRGLDQVNIIAVVARNSTITLYSNYQKLISLTDSSYSHGQIGVVAATTNQATEVSYSNAKVWTV